MSNLTRQIARQLITEAAQKKSSHPYGGKYPPAQDWDQLSTQQQYVHRAAESQHADASTLARIARSQGPNSAHPLTLHKIATGPHGTDAAVGRAIADHPETWSSTLAVLVKHPSATVRAKALESQNIRGDEVEYVAKNDPVSRNRKRAQEILDTEETGEYGDLPDGENY